MTIESKELDIFEDINSDKAPEIYGTNRLYQFYDAVKEQVSAEVPDVWTLKGRDRIASNAAKVSRSKTAVEKPGRDYLRRLKDLPKTIETELREFVDKMDRLRDDTRLPLTLWEVEQKSIEAKRIADETAAEAERLAEIAARELQEQVDRDHELAFFMYDEFLRQKEESEKQVIIDAENAATAQKEREQKIAHEAAENARIEAQREAEADKQRIKDHAARQAAEAQAAIERAKREKAESEAREKQAKIDADAREIAQKKAAELATKQAAEKAERDRLQAIADTEDRISREKLQEQAEAELREKNKSHAKLINNEIMEDFISAGLSEEFAKIAIIAIANGKIRNTKINY